MIWKRGLGVQEIKLWALRSREQVLKALFFVTLIISQLCPGKNSGSEQVQVGREEDKGE